MTRTPMWPLQFDDNEWLRDAFQLLVYTHTSACCPRTARMKSGGVQKCSLCMYHAVCVRLKASVASRPAMSAFAAQAREHQAWSTAVDVSMLHGTRMRKVVMKACVHAIHSLAAATWL